MAGTTQRTRQRPTETSAVTGQPPELQTSAADSTVHQQHTPEHNAERDLVPRKRTVFQKRGTGLSQRVDPNAALQERGLSSAVSELRSRMTQPARPSDTPLAVIDAYGHIMPFDQDSPVDRLVLANVPDITYIYTMSDLRKAQEINQRAIRERRFAETVQGARMFVEPTPVRHGFRNGQEVVTAMYDETRMGEHANAIAVNDLEIMTRGQY